MICLVFPYINIRHNLPINLSPLVTVLSVWFECFILQMLDTCHAYQSTIVSTNICQRVAGNGSESPGKKEKRHKSFLIHWACKNKELPIKILIFREDISSSLSQHSSSCIMFHCYEFFTFFEWFHSLRHLLDSTSLAAGNITACILTTP